MSTDTDSWLERVWRRLESRYETEPTGCDCGDATGAVRALERSRLSREDLAAYQRGELSMADLTAKVDADLDPGAIDGLGTLATELTRALDVDAGTGK